MISIEVREKIIAHYPHLANIKDDKIFAQNACRLAAVRGVTAAEYLHLAKVAEGVSSINYNIRKYRQEKGLTQLQLAELVNVSEKYIQKWEAGRRNPNSANLIKLAQALGVSLDDIVK